MVKVVNSKADVLHYADEPDQYPAIYVVRSVGFGGPLDFKAEYIYPESVESWMDGFEMGKKYEPHGR